MSPVPVAFYLPPMVGSEHSEVANNNGHARRGGLPGEKDVKETKTNDSLINKTKFQVLVKNWRIYNGRSEGVACM